MKKYKVYEIYDMYGNVKYVGHTSRNINRRLQEHIWKGKVNLDSFIFAVDSFDTKKEARNLEDSLQESYGFQTDTQKRKISASIGSIKRWSEMTQEQKTQVTRNSAIKRWNAKTKDERFEIIQKGHITRKQL